jgi:hypothetical protein
MNKQLFKDTLGWGVLLWLIGYVLGIILFKVVPPSTLGWIIMPVGTAITLWVLLKRIKSRPTRGYLLLGITWTLIAVIFDYLFLVKLFNSANYYKIDVYLYYLLTFVLPLLVGGYKKTQKKL